MNSLMDRIHCLCGITGEVGVVIHTHSLADPPLGYVFGTIDGDDYILREICVKQKVVVLNVDYR